MHTAGRNLPVYRLRRRQVKIEDALRTIWPFYLAILFALILVTYFRFSRCGSPT